jgi:hypothetical protein
MDFNYDTTAQNLWPRLEFARHRSWHGHKPFVGERRMLQYNFLSDSKLAQLNQKVSRIGTHFSKRVLGIR